jgi:hypothetical protein
MTTVEFSIALCCRIDDALADLPMHLQAHMYPSEVVTQAVLFALKGGGERPFCRWLTRDHRSLCPHLPERTRLFRMFATHQAWADRFLAEPTVLRVTDTYGIELLHPWRERRGSQERHARRLGRNGLSNHRWSLGGNLGLALNQWGLIYAWGAATANVHESVFQLRVARFAETMVVSVDPTFGRAQANPANMQICPRGTLNERMAVETTCLMLTLVCHHKEVVHRVWDYFTIRLAFFMATFKLLVQWDGALPRENPG